METIPTRRLFLAASAEPLRDELAPWLKKMKIGADRKEMSVRWVAPDLQHVTLLFFGDKTWDEQLQIVETARAVAADWPAFQLKIEGLSAFPEPRSGRVIWFGVQNSRKWRALRDELVGQLNPRGFNLEAAHVPHLTAGRLRSPRSLVDYLSPFERVKIGKLPVKEIVLYESIQAGPFPVYKIVERFPLTGVAAEEIDEFAPAGPIEEIASGL